MQKQTIGNATRYCGDSLVILNELVDQFDALITDPPYSSGGLHAAARAEPTGSKYLSSDLHADFPGDNRDARSWQFWMILWLSRATSLIKPGGYSLLFTDWRQLPASTDILQSAGLIWRGVIAWDKTLSARAPHTGYFRHQCEYLVWGSQGKLPKATHGGPWPGCITARVNPKEKLHQTAKPLALMQQLVKAVPPTGHILDPFMGSGTTGAAALLSGYHFTGIELTPHYFDIACQRLDKLNEQIKAGHVPSVKHSLDRASEEVVAHD